MVNKSLTSETRVQRNQKLLDYVNRPVVADGENNFNASTIYDKQELDNNNEFVSIDDGFDNIGNSSAVVACADFKNAQPSMNKTSTNLEVLERLQVITRFQREIAVGDPDLRTCRHRAAEVALIVTNADGAIVEEIDGSDMVYTAAVGAPCNEVGLRIPVEQSVSGWAYRTREVRLFENVATDDALPAMQGRRDVGFVSGIIAPLIHATQNYGVIKVTADESARFGVEARYLLEWVASIIAARLYNSADYTEEDGRRRLLVDALPMPVAYLDTRLRYREVNAAYEQLFGKRADAIRGCHVSDLLGENLFNEIHADMDAALSGRRMKYEHSFYDPQGVAYAYRVNLIPHFGQFRTVQGIYMLVNEISEDRLAASDFLTGLANSREAERRGVQAVAAARRYGHALSLLIVDVDHFKHVNDNYGHVVGDDVLRTLAAQLQSDARKADIVGRWGGEEFIFILPETTMSGAIRLGERVRRNIRELCFPYGFQISVSVGIATLQPSQSLANLLDHAESALHSAKKNGRDRVMTSVSE